MPLGNAWRQIYLRSPVLDAGGKPEYPEKTCGSKYGLETKCTYMALGLEIEPGPIGA